MPPLFTVEPLAVTPADTSSVRAAADDRANIRSTSQETRTSPPLLSTVPLAVPPEEMISLPPAMTVTDTVLPPDDTVNTPPLLTNVLAGRAARQHNLTTATHRCAAGRAARGDDLRAATLHRGVTLAVTPADTSSAPPLLMIVPISVALRQETLHCRRCSAPCRSPYRQRR